MRPQPPYRGGTALTISAVTSRSEKSEICNTILRALPNWFSVEEGIVECVREVPNLLFFAAFADTHRHEGLRSQSERAENGQAIGFIALKNHNQYTAEVRVMAVLQAYHRHGVGRMLMERCVAECRRAGLTFLTVKTLDRSRASRNYEKTRMFYHAMGFRPLEVFPMFWDAENPCLFMAMYLGK